MGRTVDKKSEGEGEAIITLSKFSILADADDAGKERTEGDEGNVTATEESDAEEGEINESQENINSPERNRDSGTLRQSIPRTTKSTYKLSAKGQTKKAEDIHAGKKSRSRKQNSK